MPTQAQRCLDAVRSLTRRFGYPPTVRDVANETGLSINGAVGKLSDLERQGILLWDRRASRGLVVLPVIPVGVLVPQKKGCKKAADRPAYREKVRRILADAATGTSKRELAVKYGMGIHALRRAIAHYKED